MKSINVRKKLISVLIVTVFALSQASPCFGESNIPYYDSIKADDITFYDMLGDTESKYELGMPVFSEQYFSTATDQTNSGVVDPVKILSLGERWKTVAMEILLGHKPDSGGSMLDKIHFGYHTYVVNNREAHAFSGCIIGDTNSSIKKAAEAARKAVNKAPTSNRKIPIDHKMPSGLSETVTDTITFYTGYEFDSNPSGTIPMFSDGAIAVIFSNFKVQQVADGHYIEDKITSREDYLLSGDTPKLGFSTQYDNASNETVNATASLTTNASEAITVSHTSSETHSLGLSICVGAKFPFMPKKWKYPNFLPEINISGTISHEDVWGKMDTKSKTVTKTTENSSSLSVTLPPYTTAVMEQNETTGKMDIFVYMPILLTYDVTIVYFVSSNYSSFSSYVVTYEASTRRNSDNAVTDLWQRVIKGAEEPSDIDNSRAELKAIAQNIHDYYPLAKSKVGLDYSVDIKNNKLYGLRPLKNLDKVELKDKKSGIDMNIDEQMDVSTIEVVGLNEANALYYGFDASLGSWALMDETGAEISGQKNEYMQLERNAITGRLMLTALAPGGTAYLKYVVPKYTYIDLDKTPIGAEEEDFVYIDPDKVNNTAALRIRTIADDTGYEIHADGEIVCHPGDAGIDLNAASSPVSAWATKDGGIVSVPLTWQADNANGITIVDGVLTAKTEGSYRIRAKWGNLFSPWLPVTVRAVPVLAELVMSDPAGLLETRRWSENMAQMEYDLGGLALSATDQNGDPMAIPDNLIWFAARNGAEAEKIADPAEFAIKEAGVYTLFVQTPDGDVASNALTLTVEEAPKLASIHLEDNPETPLFKDYALHDGADMFLLPFLQVSGTDQYGDSLPVDTATLTWVVNDHGIDGNLLTVTEPGEYRIRCYETGGTAQSDTLTFTVLEPRQLAGLTIADDPLEPLLKTDYILASGTDVFDLTELVVTTTDQYGAPYGTADVSWYVNGEELDGTILTVRKTGTYTVKAGMRIGETAVASNELALIVGTDAEGVQLDADTLIVSAGKMAQLTASPLPLGAHDVYTYLSSDESVATVDENGLITALTPGTASIEAVGGSGFRTACALTVRGASELRSFTLEDNAENPLLPANYALHDGSDEFLLTFLTANGKDQYGEEMPVDVATLSWIVNNRGINGNLLKVTEPGSYRIGARLKESPAFSDNEITFTVLDPRCLSSLTIADSVLEPLLSNYVLATGTDTFDLSKLQISALDQYGESFGTEGLSWYVNDMKLDGSILTVKAIGEYRIRAGGLVGDTEIASNTLRLTVTSDAEGIQLNKTELTLSAGKTAQLTASPLPVGAHDVYTYVSSDPEAVSVDENGLITAILPGETPVIIAVTGGSGQRTECAVTVRGAAELESFTLSDNPESPLLPANYILHDGNDQFLLPFLTASGKDQYGEDMPVDTATLTWVVNDRGIDGNLLNVSEPGEYRIRAYVTGGTVHSSNELTLIVLAARHLETLTIEDDPLTPLLSEYKIGSGTDAFDLSALTVSAIDQYGETFKPASLSWYVNGAKLDGNTMTVRKIGEYKIRAGATDGVNTAASNELTLNVVTRVTGIRLNSEAFSLSAGEQAVLIASPIPEEENDTYYFESSRPTVATVDGSGLITGCVQGTAVITAMSGSGYSAKCTVTVVNPPEALTLTPNELMIAEGGKFRLSAKIAPAGVSTTLTYTSADENVATVSDSGEITGVSTGATVIRVETHNGLYDECYVKVAPKVDAVLCPSELTLGLGEAFPLADHVILQETIVPRGISRVTYRSMNDSVALVDQDGNVTAVGKGETGITVTAFNGVTATVTVTVKKAPESVVLLPVQSVMDAGDQVTLEVVFPTDCAGSYSFMSDHNDVAYVSPEGIVTALRKGEAQISVTTYNGLTATCDILNNGVTENTRILSLPKAMRMVGSGAFSGSNARIVVIPDGTIVKAGAFSGCEDLRVVVTSISSGIEEGAFDHEMIYTDTLD